MTDCDRADLRPQQQGERDERGRLLPGHGVGAATRFPPGESPNPGGAPVGTSHPGRWLRSLCDSTPAELRDVLDDAGASASKRGAALLLLDLCDAAGTPESRRRALAELLDRCEGKARQSVDVSAGVQAAGVVYKIVVGDAAANLPAVPLPSATYAPQAEYDATDERENKPIMARVESGATMAQPSAATTRDIDVKNASADTPLGTSSPIRSAHREGGPDAR